MKYKEWLSEWLELYIRPSKKPSTFVRYESTVRLHIAPNLGEAELCELDGILLQRTVLALFESGNNMRRGTGLAATTVGQIVSVVQRSLAQAMSVGLITRQYADDICKPRTDDEAAQVKCFTEREQRAIEDYIAATQNKRLYGILITLYTGVRIGELLALKWEDIDFKRCFLSVNKTCRDDWGGGYRKIIGTPKTKSSIRVIPIPKQILPYFRALKRGDKSDFVFHINGTDISVRSYQRTFERLLNRLQLPHKGFHSLRHTFATRAIENNIDVKTLSEVMGHKSPAITLAIYAHSLPPHKRSMMNRLGKLLSDAVPYDDEEE